MPRHKRKKSYYAFIDSQNLHLSIKNLGWKLDFYKLFHYLRAKYKINKAFIFIGHVAGEDELYAHLKKVGFVVVFKPTLSYMEDKVERTKGNVDADLVLHCMIEYKNFDKAIIISGDGDFYGLAEYLHKQQKLLKIGIPNRMYYSALLREFFSYHFYISGLRNQLEYISQKQYRKKKVLARKK